MRPSERIAKTVFSRQAIVEENMKKNLQGQI